MADSRYVFLWGRRTWRTRLRRFLGRPVTHAFPADHEYALAEYALACPPKPTTFLCPECGTTVQTGKATWDGGTCPCCDLELEDRR